MFEFPEGEANKYNDPTMREYPLRCKVKTAKISAQQGMSGGQSEFTCVALIPSQSDMTTRFFMAWLPDSSEEHFEIVMEMGHPIYGTCRGAVLRISRAHDTPHIFVMSKGVEDILSKKEGEYVELKVMPANMDSIADHAPEQETKIDPWV